MNPRRIVGAVSLLAIFLVSIASVSISLSASAPAERPVVMRRLTASGIASMAAASAPASTGVLMTNLIGDPTKPGLYTVRVAIAPHTQVQPHSHRDNRSVTVMSGTWHMGYGTQFDARALEDLPPGSLYTEPAGQPHFARTTDEPVVIWVTGYGPSDTRFITR